MDPRNPLHFLHSSYTYFSNSLTIQVKFHKVAKYSYYFIQQNGIATTF